MFVKRPYLLAIAWILAIVAGGVTLGRHAATPGRSGMPPRQVPRERDTDGGQQPLLMLFVHPQCPCTRATLGELARLISRREQFFETHVLFYRPAKASPEWAETDLWRAASMIPGVQLEVDVDGASAARHGVMTSGHLLLYDTAGRLQYSGGLTPLRGHAGDGPGRSAVLSWLETGAAVPASGPVWGCSLLQESAQTVR